MEWHERLASPVPERVRRGRVHFRRSPLLDEGEAGGDESWFLVVAALAGAVLGYLVALG